MALNRRIRVALAGAVTTVALLLSGCTAGAWVTQSPPAAGSQAENKTRDKARNLLIAVDTKGKAVLFGTLTSVKGTELKSILYQPVTREGRLAQQALLEASFTVPVQGAVQLQDQIKAFTNPNLVAGLTANVTLQLSSEPITLAVPVYSSDHKDFHEAWQKVVQKS